MIISSNKMQTLKAAPNSAYEVILPEFLYQSNKIEGSTFTFEQIELFYATNRVTGDHDFDDIIETKNSFKMFDRMVDTLGVELTPELLIEFETILHKGTTMDANGESGHFKYILNRIRNSSVQVALPSDIPTAIPALLAEWESSPKDFEAISRFHARFEHLHPFQDDNGRIGRLIMMKQCIENGVDLIVIDETHADEYKSWMEIAQTQGNFRFFDEVLRKCQSSFDARMHEMGADFLIQHTPETLEEGKRSIDPSLPSTAKPDVDVPMVFKASDVAGQQAVVFESLQRETDGKEISKETDLEDTDQTIDIENRPEGKSLDQTGNWVLYAAIAAGVAACIAGIVLVFRMRKN